MDLFKQVVNELPLPAWFLAAYIMVGLIVKIVRFVDRTNKTNDKIDIVIEKLDRLQRNFQKLIEILLRKNVIDKADAKFEK